MAKFGQGFLTSLTRPSYLDSLGKTGMMIGQMPGQVMKNRRERELMEQFVNADPYDQAQILKTKAIQNKDYGLLTQAQQMETNVKQNNTRFASNELLQLLENPSTTQSQADAIKKQLAFDYQYAGMDDGKVRTAIAIADKKRLTGNAAERNAIVNAHRVRAGNMVAAGKSYEDFVAVAGPNFEHLWNEAVNAKEDKDLKDLQAQGRENIELIKGLIAKETDPIKRAKLQQKLEEEAKRTRLFGPDVVGYDERVIAARNEAMWKQVSEQTTRMTGVRNNQADQVASTMVASDTSIIPENAFPNVTFDDQMNSMVMKKYRDKITIKQENDEYISEGTLPKRYKTKLEQMIIDRPREYGTNTELQEAMKIVFGEGEYEANPKHPKYRRSVQLIRTAVDGFEERQQKAELSDENLENIVDDMISNYVASTKDYVTTYGRPDTLRDLFDNTDSDYDGLRDRFKRNAVLELKKRGGASNVSWRELADAAMKGLGDPKWKDAFDKFLQEEGRQRGSEDRARLRNMAEQLTSEDAIKEIKQMNPGMTDEEAKTVYETYVSPTRNRVVVPDSKSFVSSGAFNP